MTISLFVLLVTGSSRSQNLVANGEFGAGISGWRLVGRAVLSHSSDGANSPGALQAEGGLAGNATQAVAGQCITPVSPAQILDFQAEVRVVGGSPSYCRIALFESERSDCRWIGLGAEARRTSFSGGWDSLDGGTLTTSAGTASVEVRLHCANATGDQQAIEVRFDDVAVTPTGAVATIFADDFETGDTVKWSSTVP
jgi:hypothetical protein